MLRYLLSGLTGLLIIGVRTPGQAALLYQSIPDLTAQSNLTLCSSCSGRFQTYDSFTLASAATITEIDFNLSASTPPSQIVVGIYTLVNGRPGTSVGPITYSSLSYSDIPGLSAASHMGIVSLSGLALAAGSYDVTFYNATLLQLLGYAESGHSLYQSGYTNPNNGTPFRDNEALGFALYGTVTAAPEPASITLLGLGLIGLGAIGRRRIGAAR